MKRIILLSIFSLVLFSCGKEKKQVDENEVSKSDFVVNLDAIYEKNDSTYLNIYDKNGVDLLQSRVYVNVKGSPLVQQVSYKIKKGLEFSNICFSLSTSKEQKTIQIKGISILNNGKILIGGPGEKTDRFFANGDQLVMDLKTGIHQLLHEKPYAPGLAGNDILKSIIEKSQEVEQEKE